MPVDNGGVLNACEDSGLFFGRRVLTQVCYETALREEKRTKDIGYLVDQTVYARISEKYPEMFYHLSCRYNRQLNTHFSLPPMNSRTAVAMAAQFYMAISQDTNTL